MASITVPRTSWMAANLPLGAWRVSKIEQNGDVTLTDSIGYVTGQGGKANRDAKIATLARVIYDGYGDSARQYASARYRSSGSAVAAN